MHDLTEQQVATAGLVLKAIKQIDPYFATADMAMARGWAQIFARHDYTPEELLEGVVEFYTYEQDGKRCMPANVINGARNARERAARKSAAKHDEIQARRQARRDALDERIKKGQQQAIEAYRDSGKPLSTGALSAIEAVAGQKKL